MKAFGMQALKKRERPQEDPNHALRALLANDVLNPLPADGHLDHVMKIGMLFCMQAAVYFGGPDRQDEGGLLVHGVPERQRVGALR